MPSKWPLLLVKRHLFSVGTANDSQYISFHYTKLYHSVSVWDWRVDMIRKANTHFIHSDPSGSWFFFLEINCIELFLKVIFILYFYHTHYCIWISRRPQKEMVEGNIRREVFINNNSYELTKTISPWNHLKLKVKDWFSDFLANKTWIEFQ